MSYITENIHLLSNFNVTDPRTVANMHSYVLPWAKQRVSEFRELMAACHDAIFADEITALESGIETCERRLTEARSNGE